MFAEAAGTSARQGNSSEAGFVNLVVKYLETTQLFEADYPRRWWAEARQVYKSEAATRRERELFELVDGCFRKTVRTPEANASQ
jgi:hypothetical protein